MKTLFTLIVFLCYSIFVSAQVTVITKEQKISKFNETASQKAKLYANYKPTPSYVISDDFKATHKYLYAWIQDDVLRIASDAQIGLSYAKILAVGTKKELCSIDHNYQSAPVFSDRILLSELRAKMPGGSSGFYQLYYATKDNFYGTITFDETFIVKSPNAATVEKGPKLNAIHVTFNTMDHDKEAGKWVAVKVTKKPKTVTDYYKHVVGGLHIEDPAKWDYGDVKKFTIDTKSKNAFLSDFANGGNISVTNMPTDLWDVTLYIRFEFSDGTSKNFRRRKTSNPAYGTVLSLDFDKDFKVVKEYDN